MEYCELEQRPCKYVYKTFGIKRCKICGCTIIGMKVTGKKCPLRG